MGAKVLKRKDGVVAVGRSRRAVPGSGFDYPAQQVGQSKWVGSDGNPVLLYLDTSTGAAGQADVVDAQAQIDNIMAFNDFVFGIRGQGGNVVIAPLSGNNDGSGGAYHYGCDFVTGGTWYEDAATDAVLCRGLIQAEVSESYMGLQNKGWNCGGSGGEALSRVCAEAVSPSMRTSGFAAAPSWDGTDWISRDQGTDQDYPSIGCGMLYIYWMLSQGFTFDKIVQAGEPDGTLSTNYNVLTGKPATQAFADFQAAVQKVGGPGGFQGDNPFNAPYPQYPVGPPVPPTGATFTLSGALQPGAYTILRATATVGTLLASQPVPAGTYQLIPAAPGGITATVGGPVAAGAYSIPGATLTLQAALAAGTSYTITPAGAILPPGTLLTFLQLFCTFGPLLFPAEAALIAKICAILPAAKRPCG